MWWMTLERAALEPPELVQRVVERISTLNDEKLPRFGIWRRDREWAVTVDCDPDEEDEKTSTLFEEDYYQIQWYELWKEVVERLF
jgi:hypothetical protein